MLRGSEVTINCRARAHRDLRGQARSPRTVLRSVGGAQCFAAVIWRTLSADKRGNGFAPRSSLNDVIDNFDLRRSDQSLKPRDSAGSSARISCQSVNTSLRKVRTLPPAVIHLATRVSVEAMTLPGSVAMKRIWFPEGLK